MKREKDNAIGLTVTYLVTFLGVLIGLALLIFILALVLGPVFRMHWFMLLFYLAILSGPFVLFEFVCIVFSIRSRRHTSMLVEVISKLFFVVAMILGLVIYVKDFIFFLHGKYEGILDFGIFDLRYLCFNIFGLFAVAIFQALTMEKEKDWINR